MNKEFVIIGASGHAKVIIEIIEEMNGRIVDVIDTNPLISSILGYQVIRVRFHNGTIILLAWLAIIIRGSFNILRMTVFLLLVSAAFNNVKFTMATVSNFQ